MIIYRCDNCGAELKQAHDGYGDMNLRKDKIILRVEAFILAPYHDKEGVGWISGHDEQKVHICPQCVIDVARNGEAVTEWLK